MILEKIIETIGKIVLSILAGFIKLHGWASDIPQRGFIVEWTQKSGVWGDIAIPPSREKLRQRLEAEWDRVMLPRVAQYLQQTIATKGEVELDDLVELFQECADERYYSIPKRLALRKRGQTMWDLLPKEQFDVALEAVGLIDDYHQWLNSLLILLPGIAKHRPDLLTKVRLAVKRRGHLHAPVLYASLAGYRPPRHQQRIVTSLLGRYKGYDEEFEALILGEVAEYAPVELMPWVAQKLVECHNKPNISPNYFLAIQYFAHRIGKDMSLIDTLWPLILKMGHSHNQLQNFVLIVAVDLDAQHLSKLLMHLIREDVEGEKINTTKALRSRWLALEASDKYIVWSRVLNEISSLPREEFLGHMAMLTQIIPEIGTAQSVVDVGDAMLDVSGWQWTFSKSEVNK